ncbi:LysR family transcriptional regulator ArgP [Pseudogemmobacter faecipullorum]|uniref:LysR family transcriptional regulator ArgP n=1 Tax=Pseudogemmobacter faecipullorum TaxID=2755041 RepID=A0ABS8CGX6_9RHOB|nr:LysR family transcriptional regulator ArgP [Pseudogemmobacter faecipullorum]MCB5408463.1 LysR family transcriptional regulator ArgP [Pseudogemmobacter faecipullorum]
MLDPAQLAALAAVHHRGAFDLAAADLAVTPSAISQRIRALEERVGTLLIRRGQPCIATPAGQKLIRHFEAIRLMERQLSADLPGLGDRALPLRIAVNADSLATWLLPALAAVPGLLFDLVIADQDVAHEHLRQGEVSAAITSDPGPLQGCDSTPLGALRYRATASPAFLARHFSAGVSRDSLSRAPCLIFSEADRLQHLWASQQGLLPPSGLRGHRLASAEGFVAACLLGMGWGMNPEGLIREALARGRLCELIPGSYTDIALYWQVTRLAAPALKPLSREIRRAAATALITPSEADT